jgi:hypothetical protein
MKNTQLVVDTREGKKTKLITPDCIFVPISNANYGGLVP